MVNPAPASDRPAAAEPFMGEAQVIYFRQKLQRLRADALLELTATPAISPDDGPREGDQTDQASAAEEREFDIINRAREQALLARIDQALNRLDNGTYGYCEDTGEPIGFGRLDAEPTATLTVAAQEKREQAGR